MPNLCKHNGVKTRLQSQKNPEQRGSDAQKTISCEQLLNARLLDAVFVYKLIKIEQK